MRHFPAPARGLKAALALAFALSLGARAQQQQQAPAPSSPTIARVEGRVITQADFDRIAAPYLARLRAEMKTNFTEDVRKLANHNVLEELIRREVLAIEAQRQKITVTEAETDMFLKQDPYFQTDGKFDQAKFIQYKISPGSNYLVVLPKVRELVGAAKMDSVVRARVSPSPAALRAEWNKRNDQVRFKFFALGPNDASLEPEATEEEWTAYYSAHPDQFERKPQMRLRYLTLPLPPADDSLLASSQTAAMARGRGLADSLRSGLALDSLALSLGGAHDTGLFPTGAPAVPGLGAGPELTAALSAAESDTTIRVVGPVVTEIGVIVAEIAERQARTVPPLREVLGEVKRRADAEKRRLAIDAEKQAYYEAHRDSYRTASVRAARVILSEQAIEVKVPSKKAVEQWYAKNGATLAVAESAGTVVPVLDDSLRQLVAARMMGEEKQAKAMRTLAPIASSWGGGRDPRNAAKSAGGVMDTVSFLRGSPPRDQVFPPSFLDSLVGGRSTPAGKVGGPRAFGERTVVWKVESLDTAYVPAYDEVRRRVETEVQDQKRQKDEAEGRAHFEAHRGDYKTKPKYVIDYVAIAIPPPDSVKIPEAELRKHYNAHLDDYRRQEEVRARHILIGTRPNQTPGGDRAARARADSLVGAIRGGADFAELARRFSNDPGSGSAGGDLGFFPRGRMVKEFSDTAFALAVGAVSQPVKTQFGYHIIKVEERKPGGLQPFEEVRVDIRRQLAQARGDSTAAREARALRRRIVRSANPTKTAAAAGAKTSAPFGANEPVAGLGFIPELAPDLETLPVGRWASKTYRTGSSYVVLKNAKRVPPAPADFAEAKPQAIADAKSEKKKEILARKISSTRSALAAGAAVDSLAAPYGGMKDSGLLTRSAAFVPFLGREPRIVAKAFEMKPGVVSDSLVAVQGTAWIRVEERKAREGASFAKERAALEQELVVTKYSEWLERKKATLRIEILRADLREKPQPIQQTFTIGGQ